MNSNTSAVVTTVGSLLTTEKNTFKSYAIANQLFGRRRAPTNAK
jgi:hypothetical protein